MKTGQQVEVTLSACEDEVFPARIQKISPANAVIVAIGFSAAVGIFFGFYPALRAARMDPVEASPLYTREILTSRQV